MRLRPLLSCAILLGAMVATLLRTWRPPNDWAEAHWLLDYRFGFVKRGLCGEVLSWFGEVTEARIAAVVQTFAALFVAALFVMAVRVARAADWRPATVAALAAFLTSPFLVMTGHVVGYFDHVFFLLGAASIWLALRGRVLPGAPLQAGLVFVHEASIALTFPAFTLAVMLPLLESRANARAWLATLWPLLLPLATAALFSQVVGAPPDGWKPQYLAWLRAHEFVDRGMAGTVADQLTWPLSRFREVVGQFSLPRLWKAESAYLYLLVLPGVAVLLALCWRRARIGVASLQAPAVLFVALVPQAMHLIAYDLERIFTLSLMTTWFVAWIYHERAPVGDPVPSRAFSLAVFVAACALVVGNCLTTIGLMDLEVDQLSFAARAAVAGAVVAALCGLMVGDLRGASTQST